METAGLAGAVVVMATTGAAAGLAGTGPALLSAVLAAAGAGAVGPAAVLAAGRALCGRRGHGHLGHTQGDSAPSSQHAETICHSELAVPGAVSSDSPTLSQKVPPVP